MRLMETGMGILIVLVRLLILMIQIAIGGQILKILNILIILKCMEELI